MEGAADAKGHANGVYVEEPKSKDDVRLRELRELFGKADGDPLRVVGVGAGAWGSVFIAMLQDTYGAFRDAIQVNQIVAHFRISFLGLNPHPTSGRASCMNVMIDHREPWYRAVMLFLGGRIDAWDLTTDIALWGSSCGCGEGEERKWSGKRRSICSR